MVLDELIRALTLLNKYGNPSYPTHCEHDILTICGIDPSIVSDDDKKKLDSMGFFVSTEYGDEAFASYRYGSA